MKIYFASGNAHKKREMQNLFPDHEIVIPKDEGIDFDPEETGTTFFENSLIKARALHEIVKQPVLADDSGICVDAIDGVPGVYSSRYAGPDFPKGRPDGKKISQEEQNLFLISQTNEALGDKKEDMEKRSCRYACAMTLLLSKDRFYCVQETMEGQIIKDIKDSKGEGGFGYDPIVFIKEYNKTVAELTDEQKNAISHRGKAAKIIAKMIKK